MADLRRAGARAMWRLGILLGLASISSAGTACTCPGAPPTPPLLFSQAQFDAAASIFRARIVAQRPAPPAADGGSVAARRQLVFRFELVELYKGRQPPVGEFSAHAHIPGSCSVDFAIGSQYLIFERPGAGGFGSICTGTVAVRNESESPMRDTLEALRLRSGSTTK